MLKWPVLCIVESRNPLQRPPPTPLKKRRRRSLSLSQDAEITEQFHSDWRVVQQHKHWQRPPRTADLWSSFSRCKEGKVPSQICWECNPCHPSRSCSLCHRSLVLLHPLRFSNPLFSCLFFVPSFLWTDTVNDRLLYLQFYSSINLNIFIQSHVLWWYLVNWPIGLKFTVRLRMVSLTIKWRVHL